MNLTVDPTFSTVPLSNQEKWRGTYYFRRENYLAVTISAIATVILTAMTIFTTPRNSTDFSVRNISLAVIHISLAVITGLMLGHTLLVIYIKNTPYRGSYHDPIQTRTDEDGKERNTIKIPAANWQKTYHGQKKEITIFDYMPSSASNVLILQSQNNQKHIAYMIVECLKSKQMDVWDMDITDTDAKGKKIKNYALVFEKQSDRLNIFFKKVERWSYSFWSGSILKLFNLDIRGSESFD